MMPTSAIHISCSLEHSNIPFAEHVKVLVLYGVYGQNPKRTKSRIGQNSELDQISSGQNPDLEKIQNGQKSRGGQNPKLDIIPNWT